MEELSEIDLTIIYYTANEISDDFFQETSSQLEDAADGRPIISISMKPIDFGENHLATGKRSHVNIYRQALQGAKLAKTKYIALCEDDVLYSPEHFKYRPSPGKFAYNLGYWSIYTWQEEPLFSQKLCGRRNLFACICERDLFIAAMEERFKRWPDESKIDISVWAEPGKYERQLGVSVQETETFYTNPPNIFYSHEDALSFSNLGKRKALGQIRAVEIPYWGAAEDIRSYYE